MSTSQFAPSYLEHDDDDKFHRSCYLFSFVLYVYVYSFARELFFRNRTGKGNLPSPVAYARIIINTIDTNTAVPARIRGALVDIRFAIFSTPSRLAIAFIFGLGHR